MRGVCPNCFWGCLLMADEFERGVDAAVLKYVAIVAGNMQIAMDVVANNAKGKVGVDTGSLKADIKTGVEVDGVEVKGTVGNTLEHAVYHHQGTGIYATDGDGRKTPWGYTDPKTGEKIWTKGSKPNPYLQNAIDEEQGKITKLLGGG